MNMTTMQGIKQIPSVVKTKQVPPRRYGHLQGVTMHRKAQQKIRSDTAMDHKKRRKLTQSNTIDR